jgi:hypothetical protein
MRGIVHTSFLRAVAGKIGEYGGIRGIGACQRHDGRGGYPGRRRDTGLTTGRATAHGPRMS